MMTEQCGAGVRTDIQTDGVEHSPERDPHMRGQLMSDKAAKTLDRERTVFSTNRAGKMRGPHREERRWSLTSHRI